MNMIDIDMIRDLTNAFGPSGFEEEVVRTVAGYCDKYQVEKSRRPSGLKEDND